MPLKSASAVTGVNVITTLFMSLGYSQSGIGQERRVKQERTGGGRGWESSGGSEAPIRAFIYHFLNSLC